MQKFCCGGGDTGIFEKREGALTKQLLGGGEGGSERTPHL